MDARLTRRLVKVDRRIRGRLLSIPSRATLSGRGHDRVLRVARTIADLDGRAGIRSDDVDEALGYRVAGWDELAA
jgi:magnesium chelatase family protein